MHKPDIYHGEIKPQNIESDKFIDLTLFSFATAVKINKFFNRKIMRFID